MIFLKDFQKKVKEVVKGQDIIVDRFCILVYKHLLKIIGKDIGCIFDAPTTALFCGHSGSGKTYLVKTVANLLEEYLPNFQFVEINCKSIVQEGWDGTSFITQLAQYPKSDYGIIFLDEFDKLLENNESNHGNVNYQIQTSLLKYLEGFQPKLSGKQDCRLKLKNFIFVLAGAFNNVYATTQKKDIGFDKQNQIEAMTPELFIKCGLLPEIAGRIQEYLILNDLTIDTFHDILHSEHSIFKQYQKILKRMEIVFAVNPTNVIQEAMKSKLGARGLIQIIERELSDCIANNIDEMDLNKFSPLYVKK